MGITYTDDYDLEKPTSQSANVAESMNANSDKINAGRTYKKNCNGDIDAGEWVRWDGSGDAVLAQADSIVNANLRGVSIDDYLNGADGFFRYVGKLYKSGWGLTPNTLYYLSAATPGAMTSTAPTGSNFAVELGTSDDTGDWFYIKIGIIFASSASSQNVYETITGDTGSTTADSPTDSLAIVGGNGIVTAVTTDQVSIGLGALTGDWDAGGSHGIIGLTDVETDALYTDDVYELTPGHGTQFHDNLGIGIAPSSAYKIYAYRSYSGTSWQTGMVLNLLGRWDKSTDTYAKVSTARLAMQKWSAGGALGSIYALGLTAQQRSTGTVANMLGLWVDMEVSGDGNITKSKAVFIEEFDCSSAVSVIGTSYGIHIQEQGHARVTDSYALYIDAQVLATGITRAIHVVGGESYFGGNILVGEDVWIGIGAAVERMVFDGSTGRIIVEDSDFIVNGGILEVNKQVADPSLAGGAIMFKNVGGSEGLDVKMAPTSSGDLWINVTSAREFQIWIGAVEEYTFGNVALDVHGNDLDNVDAISGVAGAINLEDDLDGTGYVITAGTMTVITAFAGAAFLDEDDMASNSPIKVCSQQSIKKYVDDNAGGLNGSVPIGSIIAIAGEAVPTGFLECDGASVAYNTYVDLGDEFDDGAGNGIYGGLTSAGNNFDLPDYRGEFLRGWDHARGRDPNAGTRTDRGDGQTGDKVGTIQADEFNSHRHTSAAASSTSKKDVQPDGIDVANDGSYTGSVGGSETRPKNLNVIYCVKY